VQSVINNKINREVEKTPAGTVVGHGVGTPVGDGVVSGNSGSSVVSQIHSSKQILLRCTSKPMGFRNLPSVTSSRLLLKLVVLIA